MANHDITLQKTPLYTLHQELGAKLVPFAGYEMPVQYPLGIKKEHLHTREKAGLFDVSHMGQIILKGEKAAQALESLVPVDIVDLSIGQQRYALFTNQDGGVMDDLMVTNTGEHLFLVVNAACKEQDINHLKRHLANQCDIHVLDDYALLALQGPKAGEVLAKIAPESSEMRFMTAKTLMLNGVECFVTRSGYTGEDGFEISLPNSQAEALARLLLADDDVEMIGLGARDSLRLEAGLCLYGHELDNDISPVEASLVWALSKARRVDGVRAGGYLGAEVIMSQLANGVSRKRVGLKPQGKMPVRDGAEIVDEKDNVIGVVTSGGFGVSLNSPIAMGYVPSDYAEAGRELNAMVRGKKVPMQVVSLPFVKQNYYRG
ncbi:aminomethyltransferase [Thiomicrorhabdus immobilis]|uniref:aminomethyltransferase n=1 Tax=Thiomicrorhabdus immobilis TaxID=2791037 RepID=A0ABM7MCG6_9GAMM|nr:glycine cleavage system aminomethyltransferase GcvT [Thiomicrorhabdus immobilis]BCN93029.1 aminomethyltransferase [Thiomicrorhabdus immobilis]